MATKVKLTLQEWTEGWTKWDIALYVGAPVALGLAGVWFYKRNKAKSGQEEDVDSDQAPSSVGTVKGKPAETPLEKAQAAKGKGNKYFKGGKYSQAVNCYTEAINLCPSDQVTDLSTFYQNRAAAMEYMSNYDGVIQDCTKAIELNQRYTKALSRRAKAYQQVGKLRDSLEDITTACILEGFSNQTNLQLADQVLKDLGRSCAKESFKNKKPSLPSKFFIKNYFSGFSADPISAMKLKTDLNDGKTGEATTEDLNNANTPNHTGLTNGVTEPSPFARAIENLKQEEYDQIMSLCSEEIGLTNSKNLNMALLLRGTFYLMCGQLDQAQADFETLASSTDVDKKIKVNAIIKQSSILLQKDKVKEAFENFDQAIQVDSQNSDIYHHRAHQYLLVDKFEQALNDFDQSIKLNPSFPTSYVQRAHAVHKTGIVYQKPSALDEATKLFAEVIQKFPNYSDGFLMYAQSLADQGKFEDGFKYFNKAAELEPDNPNIYVHKGLLLVQWKSQLEEGCKLVKKAIQVDPKCEYAYEVLGTIDVQRGNMVNALESFNTAISLSRSEGEMAHLHSLLNAAQVQVTVAHNLGIDIPSVG
ncbi:mitochondrial import receptor subunit TOM70 [Patella vulgata]|uniref:mitochondrial import receptor subunit TOM70 n=1 Tax=Patella vulgata TaxID=6465 RepID=UPI00217F4F32|nr:mitochondrial import receptor subunit TOM70 [Patella vulgata]